MKLLNQYLQEEFPTFDFSGKNILFVTGSGGKRLATKREFFTAMNDAKQKGMRMSCFLVASTEAEISEFQIHAMIGFWVKVAIDSRQKRKLFEQSKTFI